MHEDQDRDADEDSAPVFAKAYACCIEAAVAHCEMAPN